MNWLMDNPIANMYGPQFLFLYGCAIVVTLVGCWWKLHSADPTAELPPLPLRADPDPYEIAYMRGGENEVIRLTIFNLIQRGYLKVSETKKWWGRTEQRLERGSGHPDQRHLSHLEQKVFRLFSTPRTAADIFQSDSQSADLKGLWADFDSKLQGEQALCPAEVGEAAGRVRMVGILIILGLGGYKLMVALAKGRHNVGFLIAMGFCSILLLLWVCRPPRLSRLGRDYLKRLQEVFERLKPTASHASDITLLLLVSLFGLGVLTGTAYASLGQMFSRSASGSGGCGGGCGGGGAGCGGGGCGGGGCGGCGGG
jgi:uncharacterized protein (TIGR04222 family)